VDAQPNSDIAPPPAPKLKAELEERMTEEIRLNALIRESLAGLAIGR